MPTAIDKLDLSSSDAQIKAAISDCIATEVHAGRPQDQAIAMCHSMASDKTGKDLSKGA
jgi:hypothetical protein